MKKNINKSRVKGKNKGIFFVIGFIALIFILLFSIQMLNEKEKNTSGLQPGTKAPEFNLQSTQGDIALKDFKDKNVVLYFYEGNNCQACIDQLEELNNNLEKFEELNTVVVAAVTDPLKYSQEVAEEKDIKIPIMYDPNHQLGDKYGVYNVPGGMDMGPVDTHSVFVIGKDGNVKWKEISVDDMYVPLKSILNELEKL